MHKLKQEKKLLSLNKKVSHRDSGQMVIQWKDQNATDLRSIGNLGLDQMDP